MIWVERQFIFVPDGTEKADQVCRNQGVSECIGASIEHERAMESILQKR